MHHYHFLFGHKNDDERNRFKSKILSFMYCLSELLCIIFICLFESPVKTAFDYFKCPARHMLLRFFSHFWLCMQFACFSSFFISNFFVDDWLREAWTRRPAMWWMSLNLVLTFLQLKLKSWHTGFMLICANEWNPGLQKCCVFFFLLNPAQLGVITFYHFFFVFKLNPHFL